MSFPDPFGLDKWLEPYNGIVMLAGCIAIVMLVALLLLTRLLLARTRRQMRDILSAEQVTARAAIAGRNARARVAALSANPPMAPAAPSQNQAPKQRTPYCHVKIYVDHATFTQTWIDLHPANPAVDWARLPQALLASSAALPPCANRQLVYCGTNVYGPFYADAYYDALLAQNDPARASNKAPAFRPNRKAQLRAALAAKSPELADDRDGALTAAVNREVANEIERWRQENRHNRDELLRGINKHFGYMTFPVERPSMVLNLAKFTPDGIPFMPEKGVDNRIATDLIADAVSNIYDVAILLASDADFVPPLQFVVAELGKTVIQVGLPQYSRAVRAAASGHLELMEIFKALRPGAAPTSTAPA